MMLSAIDGEALPVQIAYLEGRLQQVFEEWHQLGQWLETDQRMLASVQTYTANVHATLATSSANDQEVLKPFPGDGATADQLCSSLARCGFPFLLGSARKGRWG
jgi:hypothetical protein